MSRRDDELDEEVRAHLRMAAADRTARGETAAEAAAHAEREFGNVALVKDLVRDMWGGRWLEQLVQDATIGLRTLRRSPGFTLLSVLCLAVGIGSNAAVYSWIEGILLKPHPLVRDQDRLAVVVATVRNEGNHTSLSWPDFVDLRANSTLFDAVVTDKITGTTLSVGDRAERAPGQIVSSNYFDAIGVRPLLGRGFTPEEETGRNAHPVAVISYRMWQDRFKGDPQILGKTQMMNGVPHTIVGVMPDGFVGTFVGYAMQFWVPVSMQETFDLGGYKLEDRGARWVESFARLKPGVTFAQAEQDMQAVMRQVEARYPETNRGLTVALYPLWKSPYDAAGLLFPTLRIALVVALLVLCIACANVSNLLLVRALARRQELTVRLAIGAGRARLVRQLVTEGLVLTAIAAAGGALLAYWGRDLIVQFMPNYGVAINLPARLDWRVIALSAGVCGMATLLFALVPALQTSRVDLASAIKSDAGGVVGGTGRSRLRAGLVVAQVALSFLLVVGASLLIRSLRGMRNADPGFSTDALLSVVDLKSAGFDSTRQVAFRDDLVRRVAALPGIVSAAYARVTPFSFVNYSEAPIVVEGYEAAADEQPSAAYDEVSPGFLGTLGIPLLAGRDFARTDDDRAPAVAIVNEVMAQRYWPGTSPIGRYFQLKGQRVQVVGVAKTAHYRSLAEAPQPFYYVPLRQHPAGLVLLFMRTPLAPGSVATALAGTIHDLAPGLGAAGVITMRTEIDRQSSQQTVALSLVTLFGALALGLAAIGLYGVMSYAVAQGTRELGLRMALGAAAPDLLSLVLKGGVALTGVGVLLGAAAALGTTRLLGTLLYRVSPRDPLAFGAAALVLAVAGIVACVVPAWRAARIDPVRALRLP